MNESPTVLLTGASDGIGFETARLLVAQGCTVIAHARTPEESDESCDRLVKSGVDARKLRPAVADFTDLREVIDLAVTVAETCPRLDVLVNNAAITGPQGRAVTKDGHEQTIQVNYLAPYLLTRLLEDALDRSEVSRVVNVSSSLHRGGRINWNDLNWKRRYNRGAAYAQSKLALTMMTTALAEFRPKVREAVSVHPGVIATRMLPGYSYRGRPVAEGAEPVARLADPAAKVLNGGYYDGRLPARASATAVDPGGVRKLWSLTERLTLFDRRQA
ncbi:SDR family NAD(P)-dependent oxidoreductase [Amycolatopsis sp. cmx-4-54]|uniref:SDR family NAD(P)-dependent oxidoreductase n=1 Tax=Amycolatopsis sp. cmx-4-54 TaxID=2790936 RepID=UPI003978B5F0